MQDPKQLELSLKTLAATIFLGVAGDLLLRDVPWGIGFAIYAFVILAVGTYLYRNRAHDFGRGVLWVVPPAMLFASMFAWRDSNDLKVLNGVCCALLIGVLALRVRAGRIGIATLIDYPCRLVERWVWFLGDFVHLARLEGHGQNLRSLKMGKRVSAVARGALIAAPLLLIFGVLFASSDAVFNHYAEDALSFDANAVVSHVGIALACLWITGGFFRRLFLAWDNPHTQAGDLATTSLYSNPAIEGPPVATKLQIGITEITIVLSALNALFLSFVAIQFRYLFGGSGLVQRTAHLSYSDYARQGFFELVVVAFLGLAVLVAGHSVLRKDSARDLRSFATQAFALVALIFIVMASAATRLHLYVEAYGITRERLYAMSVLLWLTLVFAWFCATTLRRRSDRFSAGALASLLFVVVGLNVLNPDGFIAQVNTSRSHGAFDAEYLSSLSYDATPQLLAAESRLTGDAKSEVLSMLQARRKELKTDDWRSWNLGEQRASEALR